MNYVITGANRGLGLGFVSYLLHRGETVYATARNVADASALRALDSERLHILPLNVADEAQCKAFGRHFESLPVDVLINNAGIFDREGSIDGIDYDEMRRAFEVNTLGPLRVMEALLPAIRRGKHKKIVNISTQMASIDDNTSGGSYAYRASKAALNMVTRSAAIDLQPEGVIVFALHPGWVQTDMGGEQAPLAIEESIAAMMKIIDNADASTSGKFWSWRGITLPW